MGSIPFAFLLSRRSAGSICVGSGSGNVGASNVLRTSGVPRRGAGDGARRESKGALAVLVAQRLTTGAGRAGHRPRLASVIGHVYPVWLRFRAERVWRRRPACSPCWRLRRSGSRRGVFLLAVWLTRFISVGSVAWRAHACARRRSLSDAPGVIAIGAAASALVIIYRHRDEPGAARRRHRAPRRAARGERVRSIGVSHSSGRRSRSRRLGHGAGRASGARRPRGVSVGARRGARGRHARARRATRCTCPTSAFPTVCGHRTIWPRRSRGAEFIVSAVPSHGTREILQRGGAATCIAARSSSARRRDSSRTRCFACRRSSSRSCGRRRARRRAVGPELRRRSWRASCRPPCRSRRATPRSSSGCRTSSARRTSACTAPSDVVGVEIGGALKNVIAIAAGVVEGLGLGHNALAGLITRGLAEMSRLACAAGAQRETLAGPDRPWRSRADLHRRAQSQPSRRHRAGAAAASLQDVLAAMKMVAEGVRTTDAALALGGASRRRAADRRAGRRAARRTQGCAHGAVRFDAAAAASRSRIAVVMWIGVGSWELILGFFDKLRDGLTRTKQQIVSRFEEIVQQADTRRAAHAADRRRHDRSARGAADLGRRRHARDRADRHRGARRARATARACAIW